MRLLWHLPRLSLRGCGLSIRARHLLTRLRQRAHDVRLVVPADGRMHPPALVDGVPIEWVDAPVRRVPHWSLQGLQRRWRAARVASRIADDDRVDAIVTAQPEFADAVRQRTQRPVVLLACCCRLLYEPAHRAALAARPWARRWAFRVDDRFLRTGERRGFRAADAVAFDSDMTRRVAVDGYRLDERRAHVVAPTVDIRRFQPVEPSLRRELRARLSLPDDAFVVCWTGRMDDQKNVELLLSAAAACGGHIPGLRLLLVGDGPLGPQLRVEAERLGLGSSVRFTGMRDCVEPFLQASDLFALPSRVESFGISVIEAMACGLPAVVLGCVPGRIHSGAGEPVVDGQTGCVLFDDSPEAMAAHWIGLARDPVRRHQMGRAARARAIESFALGRDALQLEQILNDLCRRN